MLNIALTYGRACLIDLSLVRLVGQETMKTERRKGVRMNGENQSAWSSVSKCQKKGYTRGIKFNYTLENE